MTMIPTNDQAAAALMADAREHALFTRQAIEKLERHIEKLTQPAEWERLVLTQARPVRGWGGQTDAPTLSFGIYNPSSLVVWVGAGGGSGSKAGGIPIPATSLVVLPLAIETVEVGVDPADQGALAAGDALVWGLRFRRVQPAFMEIL